MKQTAVEWLVEQLAKNGILHSSDIAKAKQIEKEQNKQCCIKTMQTCDSDMSELRCKTMDDYFNFIYNETFKSE